MRIFCAVRHAKDPGSFFGGLWSGNFYPALQTLGHEVIESQVDLKPLSEYMHLPGPFKPDIEALRGRVTEQILAEVKQAHAAKPIDLFLSYFYNSHFQPEAFAELHQAAIPTVNFYCNSLYQFELVDQIAAKVQFAWHAEKAGHDLYKKIGARPVWVQMAADPRMYYPVQAERLSRACFIGQRYADRDRWLAALVRHEIPVDIYGSGWKPIVAKSSSNSQSETGSSPLYSQWATLRRHWQRYGWFGGFFRSVRHWAYRRASHGWMRDLAPHIQGHAESIPHTLARYEVVLNFSHVWADGLPGSRLIPHVRLRDFEGPMCRACFITGYTEELAEFYELGKEVETYRTIPELIEKTRYYLTHPADAERLRQAGYERARRDHTWERRFQQLFKAIGLQDQPLSVAISQESGTA